MSIASPATSSAQPMTTKAPSISITLSLSEYVARFAALPAPTETQLKGRFRAQFVGPAWLRLSAGPSVGLAGLRAWWGKQLSGFGPAQNLVIRDGALVTTLPMTLSPSTSLVDGQPCAVLRYGAESPFPWPHVTDELRLLKDGELLGMTVIDVAVLRGLAFPFLLVRGDR